MALPFWISLIKALLRGGGLVGLLTGCAHNLAPLTEDAVGNEFFEVGLPKALLTLQRPKHTLSVRGEGTQARVSLGCHEAPVYDLLLDLLNQVDIPYRLGALRLQGRVTLRLQDHPLLEVCQALLRNCEASACWDYSTTPATLCIENRPLHDTLTTDDGPNNAQVHTATKRIQLKHRDALSMVQNLLGTTSASSGIWKGSGKVSVAIHPESNYLYLRGPIADVERTAQLVHLADQVAPLVKVELFLLSRRPLTSGATQSPSWTLSIDQDSFLRWKPGTPTEEGIGFTAGYNRFNTDVTSPESSLKWNSVHQILQGRFIGHTELIVQTGQPMSLNVGKTGYALRTTLDSGVPSGQQVQISATTRFTITPKALPSGQIGLDISQTNARFSPVKDLSGNIAQRSINGTIAIPNGGFVILGGENFHSEEINIAYPPWLRKIPGLSPLLSQFDDTLRDEYVITLVRASLVDETSLESSTLSLPSIPVCDLPTGLHITAD